jgi:hypothetical protein
MAAPILIDRLRRELQIIKAQLGESLQERGKLSSELEEIKQQLEELRQENERLRRDGFSARVVPGDSPPRSVDEAHCGAFRASQGFPFRYVPPLEFLPQVFVTEYIDVIRIIDKYAQIFHKYHVGGGPTQRDPALSYLDGRSLSEAFDESNVKLLEEKVRELELAVLARDERITALMRHDHHRPRRTAYDYDSTTSRRGAAAMPRFVDFDADDSVSTDAQGSAEQRRSTTPPPPPYSGDIPRPLPTISDGLRAMSNPKLEPWSAILKGTRFP